MAKFKVGDRVRCAELNDTAFHVPEGIGVVTDADANTYVVRRDEKYPNDLLDELQDEWLYYPSELSPIPIPRITPIEWYAPDECLPYDGAKVLFMANSDMFSGHFNECNCFQARFCDWDDFRIDEVQFWAYAPEVK